MDLNNSGFKIPALEDENIEKIINYYKNLYKKDLWFEPIKYISNLIKINNDKMPDYKTKCKTNINTEYHIEIIMKLLESMLEDYYKYGDIDYFKKINQQNGNNQSSKISKLFRIDNKYQILYLRHEFFLDDIKKRIRNNTIDKLPPIIEYICEERKTCDIGDDVTYLNRLPYIEKKINNLEEHNIGKPRRKFRVYLNNPSNKSGLDFLLILSFKLIENRIPYTYKFNYNSGYNRHDRTIFYFPIEYINEVINIFDEIEKENPKLIAEFGTPPFFTAQKSYYGICNNSARNTTYNTSITDLTALAFFICFCRRLKLENALSSKISLSKDEINVINDYSSSINNDLIYQYLCYQNESEYKPITPSLPQYKSISSLVETYGKYIIENIEKNPNKNISINEYRETLFDLASAYYYQDKTSGRGVQLAFDKDLLKQLSNPATDYHFTSKKR